METYIINAGIDLATLIGVFLIVRFTKGYSEQKGKNLADKQDIAKLTTLVEGVKADFDKELKRFESQLKLATDLKLSHLSEARKSVIDFHAVYTKSVFEIARLDANRISLMSPEDLRSLSKSLEFVDDIYNHLSRMELLIEDGNLTNLGSALGRTAVDFRDIVKEKIDAIESEKAYIAFEKQSLEGFKEDPSYDARRAVYAGIELTGSSKIGRMLEQLTSESKILRKACLEANSAFTSEARPYLSSNPVA